MEATAKNFPIDPGLEGWVWEDNVINNSGLREILATAYEEIYGRHNKKGQQIRQGENPSFPAPAALLAIRLALDAQREKPLFEYLPNHLTAAIRGQEIIYITPESGA